MIAKDLMRPLPIVRRLFSNCPLWLLERHDRLWT